VFSFGAVMLAIGGLMQWQAKEIVCPTDPKLAEACKKTKGWSPILYFVSVGLYLVGAFFAFGTSL
jgi:hypothetical protein